MAEPTTPTIDAMVDLLPATGTESAVLGTFPIRRLKGYDLLWQRSRRTLLVLERHHKVVGDRFHHHPLPRTSAWMSSSVTMSCAR
jgi:hypothetical protein